MANWKFLYDEFGKPVAVSIEGEVKDLPEDADLENVPQRQHFETLRDVTTNVTSTLGQIKDSYRDQSIIVGIEASHAGYVNANGRRYLADGYKKNVGTWTAPVPAPYLLNHDKTGEPRGRVQKASFVPTGKGTGYYDLQTKISHKDEIEMILDGRALTVSAGQRAIDTIECSNCGHDLYHDGMGPKRYALKGKALPSREWLDAPAPGLAGRFGLTNGEFWDVKKDEETGKITALCSHMKHAEAPVSATETSKIHWDCHGLAAEEISRVNFPADVNHATGEFAHIRGLLEQKDALGDDTLASLLVEATAKVGDTHMARGTIVAEEDLWRPTSWKEAVDYALKTDLTDCFFNRGLWLATSAMADQLPVEERIKAYYEAGGHFIRREKPLTLADALQLPAAAFYAWLRAQDLLSQDEKRALDGAYTSQYLRRLRESRS